MNFKLTIAALIFVAAFATTVIADDRDYMWLRECDSRCDLTSRMNPFVSGCDDCCRRGGFSKGKCKGFGWKYCMCKTSTGQRLLNAILTG